MRRTLLLAAMAALTLAAANGATAGERAPGRSATVEAQVYEIGGRKHHFRGHHKFGGHRKFGRHGTFGGHRKFDGHRKFGGHRKFHGHGPRRHVGPPRHFGHKTWKKAVGPRFHHHRAGPPRHAKRWWRGHRPWGRGHRHVERRHGLHGKFVFILPFGR